jgi:hypothetical protein
MPPQSSGRTDPSANSSSRLSSQYVQVWEVADEMAAEDSSDPVLCWSQIMDACLLVELTLFVFTEGCAEPVEITSPIELVRFLRGTIFVPPSHLLGWRPEDHRAEIQCYIERNSRSWLAVRRDDADRWRRRNRRSATVQDVAPAQIVGTGQGRPGKVAVSSKLRRHGPEPVKLPRTVEAMRRDVRERGINYLADMKEKAFRENYGVSRDIAREARKTVLSEFADNSNSDKLSSNDK